MGFRQDVNALRALAVVSVVLFHFGISGFHGGFFGVDIFFVISGYLMTKIIVGGLDQGRFTYWGFIGARVRRIVPALLAMVVVLLALGAWALPPGDLLSLGAQARSALLFLSNLYFREGQGYFNEGDDDRWLLHTWSLSVEWQFYMLYPIGLWLLFRLRRRSPVAAVLPALAAAAALSLAWCVWTSTRSTTDAFFLLPARAWEMLAGGLVYSLERLPRLQTPTLRWSKAWTQSLLGIALLGLLAAARILRWEERWPGAYALAPVAWTALFMLAGLLRGADAAWVRAGPTQAIGRWSYSIYLWHWPFVAALQAFAWAGLPRTAGVVGGLAFSLAAGWVSYRFVEQPFSVSRSGGAGGRARVFGSLAAGVLLAAGVAAFYASSAGWPQRLSPQDAAAQAAYLEAAATPVIASECVNSRANAAGMHVCTVGPRTGGRAVLFYGDSHAQHYYPWIEANAGARVDFYTAVGCPPLPSVNRMRPGFACDGIAREATARGLRAEYDTILVAGNWVGWGGLCVFDGGRCLPIDSQARRDLVTAALRKQWDGWLAAGKRLVVFEGTPEGRFNVPKVLARAAQWGAIPRLAPAAVPINPDIERLMAEFRGRPGFSITSANPRICDGARCALIDATGYPIFKDRDHLSVRWVQQHADFIAPFVREVPPGDAVRRTVGP